MKPEYQIGDIIVSKKVDPKICETMLKRSHGQIGIFCDLLEIAPITYKTNFLNVAINFACHGW